MELLMWLAEVAIWRLQRKDKAMSRNDKITGSPKAPTGMYMDSDVAEMYQSATDEYRRIAASGSTEITAWARSMPEWYQNEIATRAIDDARNSKRR